MTFYKSMTIGLWDCARMGYCQKQQSWTVPTTGSRPSFFWQGLMILLPVAVLAVVGLYSLRQDAQAAEQAAHKGRPRMRGIWPVP